jgi:protein involved in polysaccharide export with SLBB domain
MYAAHRLIFFLAGLIALCLGLSSCFPRETLYSAAPFEDGAEYVLGPGDELRVDVFNQPNLSGEFPIDSAGSIALPLVGQVAANNQTTRALELSIAEALTRGGFLVNPSVTVQVIQFRPYYILGEVGAPGAYAYSSGLTVRMAVASAKGFTYRANTRRVYIQRSGQNEERLFELTPTTTVRPGDIIRIPERFF